MIIAKENPLNISPPRKKIESNANSVVTDVKIVLDKVSFIDWFVKSKICKFIYFLRLSRTLSKITTVSFIEYPTIVNTAATIDKFISKDKKENIPNVIITSWNSANIAPRLNYHSNLIQI